jgi:hypothetical protein
VPTSTPVSVTFGQLVSEAVKRQKAAFAKEGRVYKVSDLAAMVDTMLPDFLERYPYQNQAFALESPTDAKESKSSPFGDAKVIPPSPAQVAAYSASKGHPIDGQHFCDHYEQKGWVVGRTKMKNWQAAVNLWIARDKERNPVKTPTTTPRDYSKI